MEYTSRNNPPTYVGEGTRQLSLLAKALDKGQVEEKLLHKALEITTRGWGHLLIPHDTKSLRWVPDVSNDHSPFEYSVALNQETGEADLRFLIEAQPSGALSPATLTQLQTEAVKLSWRLANEYGSEISWDRFNAIRDLFIPSNPAGSFAMWYSYALGRDGGEWKVYFNPQCTPGRSNAIARTRAAFERLGLAEPWAKVERSLGENESVVYFSLDLSSSPSIARVKVYISHGQGSSALAIARKHEAICPNANPYEIQRFCGAMSGGKLGPYERKSLISCFAFTSAEPDQPIGTVHFPVSSYASNDHEIQERISNYINAVRVPDLFKERYRNIINAMQRRQLNEGINIHAWVSLKQASRNKQTNAFYLSAGLFGSREL
ncbi:hypothetical protein F5Y11DRAFT_311700 [Daldinia sp. FL1419]|nr:hypothetical protein F5Y11DRAFT_311700 [Daldinia sp. FL1419]